MIFICSNLLVNRMLHHIFFFAFFSNDGLLKLIVHKNFFYIFVCSYFLRGKFYKFFVDLLSLLSKLRNHFFFSLNRRDFWSKKMRKISALIFFDKIWNCLSKIWPVLLFSSFLFPIVFGIWQYQSDLEHY